VFNLIKAFYGLVGARKEKEPYLIPIGERAEQIARLFYAGQISSQKALKELQDLVEELRAAEEARRETDLSPEGFAVFWYLEGKGVDRAREIALAAEDALRKFPHWDWDPAQERELRKELYKAILGADGVEGVRRIVEGILKLLRRQ